MVGPPNSTQTGHQVTYPLVGPHNSTQTGHQVTYPLVILGTFTCSFESVSICIVYIFCAKWESIDLLLLNCSSCFVFQQFYSIMKILIKYAYLGENFKNCQFWS